MKIPNLNAEVKWSYPERVSPARLTLCTVIFDEGEHEFIGTAVCSKEDQFNREIGRKVSLSRALKQIPRSQRKPFWEAFRTMKAEPKW